MDCFFNDVLISLNNRIRWVITVTYRGLISSLQRTRTVHNRITDEVSYTTAMIFGNNSSMVFINRLPIVSDSFEMLNIYSLPFRSIENNRP